jgi:hypothetical protein
VLASIRRGCSQLDTEIQVGVERHFSVILTQVLTQCLVGAPLPKTFEIEIPRY